MARDIDRKFRLTAAVLGAATHKDLAAAFRRINPATPFDVDRAYKWLQGRAQPRERQIYEDWSKVLGLDRPGQWIADCDIEAFLDEICTRHGCDREDLLHRLGEPANRRNRSGSVELAGTFVCYSHAWSPYFRGRLVRGELTLGVESSPNRLPVSYTEVLPTGTLALKGAMFLSKHGLHIQVGDLTGDAQAITFCLFPAAPPASVLGGLMLGTTLISPDAQPSVTRVVLVRLPAASPQLRSVDAYLPRQGSVAEDLAQFGLHVGDATAVDLRLAEFLSGSSDGFDQVPVSAYRALADLFDRDWLVGAARRPGSLRVIAGGA
ncbi:hypothetical protein AB4Z01_06060 [Inquilinus sp. YAF38]|uniref:hypothetical protein n=1 Tax=Inquilinus sp. YAF38 TaxID=3233084 RepID=UPI003F910ADD